MLIVPNRCGEFLDRENVFGARVRLTLLRLKRQLGVLPHEARLGVLQHSLGAHTGGMRGGPIPGVVDQPA